jgi:hypothetical protein
MTVQNQAPEKRKLSVVELVFAAWPLALVAVGGALGGLCGGVAAAINVQIMRSGMSAPMRYGLSVLVGLGGVGLWLLAVFLLAMTFPGMFAGG